MTYDFIIVGAGTAGCVLANRLSAAGHSTLLVEAGPDMPPGAEPEEIRSAFPRASSDPNWFWSGLKARTVAPRDGSAAPARPYPQAQIVGGGSSINGMISLRGSSADYDEWAGVGAAGWHWKGVLPFFKSLERDLEFNNDMHGQSGPLILRRTARADWGPLVNAFAAACEKAGYRDLGDLNGHFEDGYGAVPLANIDGHRLSSASAFLDSDTRRRTNLRILAGTKALRICWDGTRATGVEVEGPDGAYVLAGREIILSAGAIHSPTLLLRSGVGPAGDLEARGIAPMADRQGVGRNLRNHAGLNIPMHLPAASRQREPYAWAQGALRYSSHHERCTPGDMMMFCIGKSGWHPLGGRIGALSISVYKTYSTGRVSLGADFGPDVEFNMLSDDRDFDRLAEAAGDLFRRLDEEPLRAVRNELVLPNPLLVKRLSQPGFGAWGLSKTLDLLLGGPSVLRKLLLASISLDASALARNDAAVRRLILDNCAPSGHALGTCRLGSEADPAAVVDSRCRVIGVEGVRVADASIMPTMVTANTNLPAAMIGEKAAAMIVEDVRS